VPAADRRAVLCGDAATGKERWPFRYPAAYTNPYGNGPRATPAIAGEYLYSVGATGIMHCLKAFTDNPAGELVWRKELLEEFGASNLQWGVSFSPLVEGRFVYVMPGGPNGNGIAALDKDTGAVVWKNLNDQAGYSSPIAATLAGDRQIVVFTAERLVGVAPDTGERLWDFPWHTDFQANIATPVVMGD